MWSAGRSIVRERYKLCRQLYTGLEWLPAVQGGGGKDARASNQEAEPARVSHDPGPPIRCFCAISRGTQKGRGDLVRSL